MTQETPFFLMFGRDPRFPFDNIINEDPTTQYNLVVDDHKKEMGERMAKAHALASEILKNAGQKMAKIQHKNAKQNTINLNDLVLFRNYRHKVGEYGKFRSPWRGIFEVVNIEPDGKHCTIKPQQIGNETSKEKRVHMNQIKRYHQETIDEIPSEEEEADSYDNADPQCGRVQADMPNEVIPMINNGQTAKKAKKVRFEPQPLDEVELKRSRTGRVIKPTKLPDGFIRH